MRQVKVLRDDNIRQIGIVCHAERYWDEIIQVISQSNIPSITLNQRGERFDTRKPLLIIGRPDTVGGQEFDAVIAVGLEQGLVPPRVLNSALATALEQQTLREMYVSFTRARYRLVLVNSHGSAPTAIIADAIKRGYISQIPTRQQRVRTRAKKGVVS